MASTLLPTKMEGTQGLEVRSWKPNLGGLCVARYLSQLGYHVCGEN